MLSSRARQKVWLAALAAGVLTLAGCSNQAPKQGETTETSKKVAPAKPVEPPVKQAREAKPAKPLATPKKATSAAVLVTVPKGTSISATVSETLASNKNHAGDAFAASVSTPIKVGGKIVIPKGAHVTGRVLAAKKKGPAELTVALASVEIQGKSYALKTNSLDPSGKKDITVPAASRLKFKLAKSVNIPVRG
jgi:outer membrane murein-binding lipoprotein Lpp